MVLKHWLDAVYSRLAVGGKENSRAGLRRRRPQSLSQANIRPLESLEERVLLAAPQLIGVEPSVGEPVFPGEDTQLNEAFRTLTFEFSEGQIIDPASLDSIQFVRSNDGVFGNGDDITITPGAAVIGDETNQVVVRFAENLPDDFYQITLVGAGMDPLQNTDGEAFNNGVDQTISFELDLSPQAVAVVPQPILRETLLQINDPNRVTDGDTFTLTAGDQTVTFEFDTNNSGVATGNVRIQMSTAEPANQIATRIANTIRLGVVPGTTTPISEAVGGLTATSNGASVEIRTFDPNTMQLLPTGAPFTPQLTVNVADTSMGGAIGLSTSSNRLQLKDRVNVYFNANDLLDPVLAENPTFYQLIQVDPSDASTIGVFVPEFATYVAGSNTVSLQFEEDLPVGIFKLRVGTSSEAGDTLATAANAGTLTAEDDPMTGPVESEVETVLDTIGYIGDGNSGTSFQLDDYDLYRIEIGNDGTELEVTLTPFMVDLGDTLNGAIRVFDSTGLEIASENTGGDGVAEMLTVSGLDAGTYYIGVSSSGNTGYDPVDGSGRTVGTTLGSYRLRAVSDDNFIIDDDNSSFDDATELGALGSSSVIINSQIEPQTQFALPRGAGSNDEPGHRDIQDIRAFPGAVISGETHNGANSVVSATPNGIRQYFYNFRSDYGVDPVTLQPLSNQITENQKERAREIFALYGQYTGIQFIENELNLGTTIVTGDPRTVAPIVPPEGLGGIAGTTNTGVPVALMNAIGNYGTSPYGGSWFEIAVHEIGHTLGLGHASDIEAYLAGTGAGPGIPGIASGLGETYPGDNDILHLLRLDPTDSTDIDLFEFSIAEDESQFTAEIIAQRQDDSSLLDSVLTLFDADGNAIAQNNDYNGRDAFLDLVLSAGTYYIGVTSDGNADYNPDVANSGFGGRTDGAYELRLNVTTAAANALTDSDNPGAMFGPNAFDGDADGKAGGTFEFSFEVADETSTLFVDKVDDTADRINPTTFAADVGTIDNPFNNIDDAIEFANANGGVDVIRILGNTSDAAYQIGFDASFNPLEDGEEFEIPGGVTVMIDEGAIFKMSAANIDAGTTSQGIDENGAALQVLGTPTRNVFFTSFRDDTLGGDTAGVTPAPQGGEWGGLVFRNDSDFLFRDEFDATLQAELAKSGPLRRSVQDQIENPIFLNFVNQAEFRYGGGRVSVNSVESPFAPIHLIDARPTVTYSTITLSAGAAISASPDSFRDRLDRVGPDVYGNSVIANSLNGMFIRTETPLGQEVDKLEGLARFDDTDIVHILQENVLINGEPGGPFFDGTVNQARVAGRLVIDPDIIVKADGGRIEAERGGAMLIAEGTESQPVIITSISDNRYGIGGTFGTRVEPGTGPIQMPVPGDWGGLTFNAATGGYIDNAFIAFGGGVVQDAGGFTGFNTIEIRQADVRVANSTFENNAGGTGGTGGSRNGRGSNASALIYVQGAQPVIVGNEFVANAGSVINVNANSLTTVRTIDQGRATGLSERYSEYDGNFGLLARNNRMEQNGLNGMTIRGQVLATETVWDDVDIVHILRDMIGSSNHHTYGGLRVQSSTEGSLVVKLQGSGAGFRATGLELDIDDRIGGRVQFIGQPGRPVILTSLFDDTVGASFQLDGTLQTDTNNDGNATTPSAGDWNSIRLEQLSNDRNVEVINEREQPVGSEFTNNTPSDAQLLGTIAPDLKSGDENRRLGFEVRGSINFDDPSDVDVYSFRGVPGTEVWLDIDRTGGSLDAIVELIRVNQDVRAISLDNGDIFSSLNTAGFTFDTQAYSLEKFSELGGDYYTNNPFDPGMRLILPGTGAAEQTYFVRVRSASTTRDGSGNADVLNELTTVGGQPRMSTAGGITSGEYQLQIRLQQRDEIPGSTVQFSEIAYATIGIDISGLPGHSPLLGESAEAGNNNSRNNAQFLGNLLSTDRAALGVSGAIANPGQVDWYQFDLDIELIQSIGGLSAGGKNFATVFDIDYANGLTRPDTTISVFDSNGNLIFIGRDSDIEDDQIGGHQVTSGAADDRDDLSRGSFGTLDPYIGTTQLPTSGSATYYVAISANSRLPEALNAQFNAGSGNTSVRLEPISSVQRIVEDHIGFTGHTTGDPSSPFTVSSVNPTTGPLLPMATTIDLQTHVVPHTFSDVLLFAHSGRSLRAYNPFTGETIDILGDLPNNGPNDLTFRQDGTLYAHGNSGNRGRLIEVDLTNPGGSGVQTEDRAGNSPNQNWGGIAHWRQGNNNFVRLGAQNDGHDVDNTMGNNQFFPAGLFVLDDDGDANDHGGGTADDFEPDPIGALPRDDGGVVLLDPMDMGTIGPVVGLAMNPTGGGTIYASTAPTGGATPGPARLFRATVSGSGTTTNVNLSSWTEIDISQLTDAIVAGGAGMTGTIQGLTFGPQNLDVMNNQDLVNNSTGDLIPDGIPDELPNGFADLANTMFAVTDDGEFVAFDIFGTTATSRANTFDTDSDGVADADLIDLGGGLDGLAFSPLDFNLWHPTIQRSGDTGHGVNSSPDGSRTGGYSVNVSSPFSGLTTSESVGGASFYFGLEQFSTTFGNNYFRYYTNNGQYGVLNDTVQRDLTSNANIGDNYNTPGGAYGSLITNPFSLEDHDATDKPTLYFNYFLDTENSNSLTGNFQDGARVWASTDAGLTWDLLVTNNSPRNGSDSELPETLSVSENAFGTLSDPRQDVQELYDTDNWRQARVDLANFVGEDNILLRFDFSTYGQMPERTDGEGELGQYGDGNDVGGNGDGSSDDNNYEGFYIDDIIIGFAERGEMVTGSAGAGDLFVQVPQSGNPLATPEIAAGAYQLEIRPGEVYGILASEQDSTILIANQFDTNDRLSGSALSLIAPDPATISDGDTFTLNDGVWEVTYEFDPNGDGVVAGRVPVTNYTTIPGNVPATATLQDYLGTRIAAAINSTNSVLPDLLPDFDITATSHHNSELVHLAGSRKEGAVSASGIANFKVNRKGDLNRDRDQGQIIIRGNEIAHSANYGITVDAARDGENKPALGGVIAFPTLNVDRLAPGVVITNNVVVIGDSGTGGISISGDPNSGTVANSAVPLVRVINNTVYGAETPNGIGVNVTENAAPTLLNNIIANTATGVQTDGTSGQSDTRSVINYNVYSGNNRNGFIAGSTFGAGATIGSEDTVVDQTTQPLFVDPANGNFYLAAGTNQDPNFAVDTSLNTLAQRQDVADISTEIGIPVSNLVAPEFDRFGTLRVDDPGQQPLGGGANVFIDRGAIERADFNGPRATLSFIFGQSPAPTDLDPSPERAEFDNKRIIGIQINLDDFDGIGLDDNTVTAAQFTLTRDGVPLVIGDPGTVGADVIFTYNSQTDIVVLNHVSGLFPPGTYDLVIDNDPMTGVRDQASNTLQANQGNGDTSFEIELLGVTLSIADIDVVEGDFGTSQAQFVVTLSEQTNAVVQVDYTVFTSTDNSDNATADVDYSAITGTLTINQGQSSGIINVPILGDTIIEGDETFTIQLSDMPINARILGMDDDERDMNRTAQGTIIDDDPKFSFPTNVPDPQVLEDEGPIVFQVALLADPKDSLAVDFETAPAMSLNPATSDVDFAATNGTLILKYEMASDTYRVFIDIGGTITEQASLDASSLANLVVPIPIPIIDDVNVEASEVFNLNLLNPRRVVVDDSGIITNPMAPGVIGIADGVATGTILDNEPVIELGSATITETDTNIVMQFPVTVTGDFNPMDPAVTVNFRTIDGSAEDGIDYNLLDTTLTFIEPGMYNVEVEIIGDDIAEGISENFLLVMELDAGSAGKANLVGEVNGEVIVTGTIRDDDTPSFFINDVTILETDDVLNPTQAVFTVTLLNRPAMGDYFVDFQTSLGTATAGDLTPQSGRLEWLEGVGDDTRQIIVPILNDDIAEADKTFFIDLTLPTGVPAPPIPPVILDGRARGLIIDDDTPKILIDNVTTTEGNFLTFTVSITQRPQPGQDVTVDFATSDVSAIAGFDYFANFGTLTFTDTSPLFQPINVTTITDSLDEVFEYFSVELSNVTNAAIVDGIGYGSIVDTNATLAQILDIADQTMLASDDTTEVVLPEVDSQGFAITYDAAVEFSKPITATFKDGNLILDPVSGFVGDAQITLTGQTAFDGPISDTFTLTVLPPTVEVSVAVSPTNVDEDSGNALAYTFTRTGVLDDPLTIDFTLAGVAQFGIDYNTLGADSITAAGGSITFAAGMSTTTLSVVPIVDPNLEPDESVVVMVVPGGGYIVDEPSQAVGIIDNDDTAVSLVLEPTSHPVDPTFVNEDDAENLLFTFSREGVIDQDLTVNFTVNGTAIFNNDYTVIGADTFDGMIGTVTFLAGNTTATVTIDPSADGILELDETIGLTLTTGTNYVLAAPVSASGTIINDEVGVGVLLDPVEVVEDEPDTLVFTFFRVGPLDNPVTANFSVGGAALFGEDYTVTGAASFDATSGSVSFPAGVDQVVVTIDATNDAVLELDEDVVLTIVPGPGYQIKNDMGEGMATGTILNDEIGVTLTVSPDSVAEDTGDTIVYTFTRTGLLDTTTTVSFQVGGSATFRTNDMSDYTVQGASGFNPSSGIVTFAPGESVIDVILTPEADTTIELDETVTLTLVPGGGYIVDTPNTATATILNDDVEVGVTVTPETVFEDGNETLVFTFTRTGLLDAPLTANFSVDGTALVDDDFIVTGADSFTDMAGTITFPANSDTVVVTLDPIAETDLELDETITLTIVPNAEYVAAMNNAATGTIVNDDTTVTVTVFPGAVTEDGPGILIYSFRREGFGLDQPLTVNVGLAGSAIFEVDYTLRGLTSLNGPNGTITFAANSDTVIVNADPNVDLNVEPAETVIFTIQPGAGYTAPTGNTATGTILNDDRLVQPLEFIVINDAPQPPAGVQGQTRVISGDFDNSVPGLADPDDLFFWNPITGANGIVFGDGREQNSVVPALLLNGNDFAEVVVGNFDNGGGDDLFFWNPATGRNRLIHFNGGAAGTNVTATVETAVIENPAINGNDFLQIAVGDFNDDNLDELFFWNPTTGRNRTVDFMAEVPGTVTIVETIQTNAVPVSEINGNDFQFIRGGQFDFGDPEDLFFVNLATGKNRILIFDADVVGSGVSFVDSKTNRIEPTAINGNDFTEIAIGDFDDNRLDDLFLWNPATGKNRTALATLFDADPFVISTNDIEPLAVNGNDFDQVIPFFSDATGPDTTGLYFLGSANQRSRMAMPIVPPLNAVPPAAPAPATVPTPTVIPDSILDSAPLALDLDAQSAGNLDEVFTDFDALLG